LSTLTKIGIIGLGAWGQAIAKLLSNKMDVLAYARNNKKDLPYCAQTTNLNDLKDRNLVFIATPVGSFESVLKQINNLLSPEIIMWGSKGIDQSTGLLPHQIFEKTIGNDRAVGISFSGPTFSGELSEGLPSAVALASINTKALNQVSEILKGTNIRSYQTQDVMGVELAGATKNIYAICSGIMAKKGLGENAQAAFITRALHEMANLGDSMGADKNTFYGLSGIGDLVLTSYGQASRNRSFGELIGSGKSCEDALSQINEVVEGYYTTKAIYQLAQSKGLEMPIATELYKILYDGKNINNAIKDLLDRPIPTIHKNQPA